MRALFKSFALATAALGAAVGLYVVFTLPSKAIHFDAAIPNHLVFGAYHVHTTRSDGSGAIVEIAAAAARAGLRYVILTDHGDATRAPEAPQYLDGVLVIDAVEISTDAGHVVALGLREASPYPLAGTASSVIDDIHRMGGRAFVAHPDSIRVPLQWRDRRADVDGIEWFNVDSEWRDESWPRVFGAGARSLLRPAESLATLFSRPGATLQRWDAMTRVRSVAGIAAVDAHASLAWDGEGSARPTTLIRMPSYEALFRSVGQAAVLTTPLTGRADEDAAAVLGAITSGHTFSLISAAGGPAIVEFSATQDGARAGIGDRLEAPARTAFQVAVPAAPGARMVLLQNGREVANGQGRIEYSNPGIPGAYRVEVFLPTASVPWIVTNPIYLGEPAPVEAVIDDTPASSTVLLPAEAAWQIEKDARSTASVDRDADEVRMSYALAGGQPSGQFAAMVAPVEGDNGFDRVQFTVRASRPMRLWLQLRLPGGRDGQRWGRSVYVDTTPRLVVVRLQDLAPLGVTSSQQPIVARIRSVLFVVDTVNALPGSSGTIYVTGVALGIGQVGG